MPAPAGSSPLESLIGRAFVTYFGSCEHCSDKYSNIAELTTSEPTIPAIDPHEDRTRDFGQVVHEVDDVRPPSSSTRMELRTLSSELVLAACQELSRSQDSDPALCFP